VSEKGSRNSQFRSTAMTPRVRPNGRVCWKEEKTKKFIKNMIF
jgi:hypothetical protein